MNPDDRVGQLLRWRLAVAEASAPPPPTAASLLAERRPWWERWPDRFHAHVERLRLMPLQVGYAMVAAGPEDRGHPVPVVIDRGDGGEAQARIVYFSVRDDVLRMRFTLDDAGSGAGPVAADAGVFDATFVGPDATEPLLEALAELTSNDDYRLEVALPSHVAEAWRPLRAADAMPFRLILRPAEGFR